MLFGMLDSSRRITISDKLCLFYMFCTVRDIYLFNRTRAQLFLFMNLKLIPSCILCRYIMLGYNYVSEYTVFCE